MLYKMHIALLHAKQQFKCYALAVLHSVPTQAALASIHTMVKMIILSKHYCFHLAYHLCIL